jgi:hypothetical protein
MGKIEDIEELAQAHRQFKDGLWSSLGEQRAFGSKAERFTNLVEWMGSLPGLVERRANSGDYTKRLIIPSFEKAPIVKLMLQLNSTSDKEEAHRLPKSLTAIWHDNKFVQWSDPLSSEHVEAEYRMGLDPEVSPALIMANLSNSQLRALELTRIAVNEQLGVSGQSVSLESVAQPA